MAGGLHEPAVEAGRAAAARHLQVGAIEGQPARLVHVEAVVQHATDHPSRLADPEDQHFARRGYALERMVAEPGQQIANACEARTGHVRILGRVGELVDRSRLKSPIQVDPAGSPNLLGRNEAPAGARDRLPCIVRARTPAQ